MHVQSQQCGVQTRDLAWPSYCLGKKHSHFHEADKEFEQPQGILRPLGHGLLITCFWVKINYGVPQTRMIQLDCLLLSQHSPWRRDNWKLFLGIPVSFASCPQSHICSLYDALKTCLCMETLLFSRTSPETFAETQFLMCYYWALVQGLCPMCLIVLLHCCVVDL